MVGTGRCSSGSKYRERDFGELRKEEKLQNSCLGDCAWEKIGESQ